MFPNNELVGGFLPAFLDAAKNFLLVSFLPGNFRGNSAERFGKKDQETDSVSVLSHPVLVGEGCQVPLN